MSAPAEPKRAGLDWWSLQTPLPTVKAHAWVRNPIDTFILAKLEANGLHPAPPADNRTLIRRVTDDLLGVPPTPEEIRAFVNNRAPDAYDKLVDRLLADPRYSVVFRPLGGIYPHCFTGCCDLEQGTIMSTHHFQERG